jgi:lysophospholipase L1-like esterase
MPPPVSNRPLHLTYAALGASETYGVGAEPRTEGYAFLVARALTAETFVNAGVSGATLREAAETEVRTVVAARPALSARARA